ncbi:NADH dehydrogenase [ubiquinone] 1 subunit C2 [Phymastichus coffea]|uniref:NADH dehydrogenase [ubiquinone] 1 subunit C2 n=1 Tax=Phymastichus coffea TaxID=108790 RepID=UPI00273ADC74|nr:NADH dehydrogenase [ubiquinone] 1 subunit C2 [Phymastichus coffea]
MSSDSGNTDIQWALDILTPDPNYEPNFFSKWFHWIVIPGTVVSGVAYVNYFQRRPIYAGLRRYAIALVAGLVGAKVLEDAKWHREAERDAVLRHYVKLHPEDFPPPKKETYNDVFWEWVPVR